MGKPPPFCPACQQPVIQARTEAMHWQALEPRPSRHGNVHARTDGRGNWYARTVAPRTPAVAPDRLYMPHAAVCPQRGAVGNLVFLDARRATASGGAA